FEQHLVFHFLVFHSVSPFCCFGFIGSLFTVLNWTGHWKTRRPVLQTRVGFSCRPALPEARLWGPRCGRYCCWDCWGYCAVPQPCRERSAPPVLPHSVLLGLSCFFGVFCFTGFQDQYE